MVRADAAADESERDAWVSLISQAAMWNEFDSPFPWGGLAGPATLAISALRQLSDAAVAEQGLRRILEARLARGDKPIDRHALAFARFDDSGKEPPAQPSNAELVADEALRSLTTAYAPLAFSGFIAREQPALLSELTDEQRQILETTSKHGLPLPIRAIPWITPEQMQRFLAGASGPLEAPLTVQMEGGPETDVTWRWLFSVANHQTPQDKVDRVLNAITATLSTRAILDLCFDLLTGAYASPYGGSLCLPFQKWEPLLVRLEDDAESIEAELTRKLESAAVSDGREARLLVRPLFSLSQRRQTPLPSNLDDAVGRALDSRNLEWSCALLRSLPLPRRSRLIGQQRHLILQDEFLKLCDRDLVRRSLKTTLPSWNLRLQAAREPVLKLFDHDQLREACSHARGKTQAILRSVLAELDAAADEHTLLIVRADSGLRATLVDAGERALQALVLPNVPKQSDLAPLFAERTPPVRLRIELDFDDHTLGYRLQKLISECGVQTVAFGGSTLTTRLSARE